MNRLTVCSFAFAASLLSAVAGATEHPSRELRAHLASSSSRSPYTFVRAQFEPGETTDPWAVRFFDDDGTEIPYFVWDSVTWQVASAGRDDWGNRYALLNHAPGDDPQVRGARSHKLAWARAHAPSLGAKLGALHDAAARSGDSLCSVLYLLQHTVQPPGKKRITLRIYPTRQVEPSRNRWTEKDLGKSIAVEQGELGFRDLPGRLSVTRRGRDLFRYVGFDAGQTAGTSSHADPTRPFVVESISGIITRLTVSGQTPGRAGGEMDWQCTYWLFPQGTYVALEGYSLGNTAGYIGGTQKMSIWQGAGSLSATQSRAWETAWWLHKIGNRGYVATHLFHSTPLAVGYGNNPFAVNSMCRRSEPPRWSSKETGSALRWSYSLDDLAVTRSSPELYYRLGHGYTAASRRCEEVARRQPRGHPHRQGRQPAGVDGRGQRSSLSRGS